MRRKVGDIVKGAITGSPRIVLGILEDEKLDCVHLRDNEYGRTGGRSIMGEGADLFDGTLTDEEEALAMRLLLIGE